MPLKGADMLVPRRVIIFDQIHTQQSNHIFRSIFLPAPQKNGFPLFTPQKKTKLQNTPTMWVHYNNSPNPKKKSHF